MKQELQNLRLARFSLYKNLYDILITKLRVHGYEPQADIEDNDGNRHINPLATRNADQFFWPEFINNQTVRIIVDGIDVSNLEEVKDNDKFTLIEREQNFIERIKELIN